MLTKEQKELTTDVSERVYAKTKGGKDIVIFVSRQGYWKVKFLTGGQLPSRISGRYTTYIDAAHDVDGYIATEEVPTEKTVRSRRKTARKPRATEK